MKRAEVRYIPPKWCASGVVPHVYSKSVGASKPDEEGERCVSFSQSLCVFLRTVKREQIGTERENKRNLGLDHIIDTFVQSGELVRCSQVLRHVEPPKPN